MSLSGKGTNPKTTLYVGGLEDNVTEAILHAAFIPFGDLKDVSVPMDHATGKHRGFGFIQYETKDDADDAIDNMNNAGVYVYKGVVFFFLFSNVKIYMSPPEQLFHFEPSFLVKSGSAISMEIVRIVATSF